MKPGTTPGFCTRQVSIVALLALTAAGAAADTAQRPLRLALEVSSLGSDARQQADRTLRGSIEGREAWFHRVAASEPHDLLVEVRRETDESSGAGIWVVRLEENSADRSRTGETARSRAFPSMAAIEPFLAVDLQRIYITRNLKTLSENDIDVDLTLAGVPGHAPELDEGQSIAFHLQVDRDCYLNLINVDPEGHVRLVYPQGDQTNRVRAGTTHTIPGEGLRIRVSKPFGPEYVKAVCTSVPLDLSFLDADSEMETTDIDDLLAKIELTRGGAIEIGTSDLHFVTRPAP